MAHLGITEETVGAPILADMDVVERDRTPGGLIAYCDRITATCDGILAVNRFKPHDVLRAFGSGLALGLGKVPGASQIHREGPAQMVRAIEEIAKVVPMRLDEMIARERELFCEAKALMSDGTLLDVAR